ncbi:nSTAND1 domain-containing NTPase [Actinoplanes aureus]|uniref:Novel STAND NTPase 1 domain-containing protein n=1 Tax=Actinoplanes aureus TaxID=2792083 RepID=A0A931CCJ7_9ACTN|nr:helix-turn-helix domain-containing protein [Actinoplanes aureus]MBG0564638.1 hypothetical protein [Actinoplanes aureus]
MPSSPVAEFCADLRRLQESSGVKRAALAHRLGYSRSQLYEILSGNVSRPPDWSRLVEPLVRACAGDDPATLDRWRRRHGVLLEVHTALRRHDRRAEPARLPCPYRGLRAFEETDAALFFGREELTDRLVDAVERNAVVAVAGPSGSGKSSLVLAGAVPRLRSSGWAVAVLRPASGPTPEAAMAAALARLTGADPAALELRLIDQGAAAVAEAVHGTGPVLLVVDQFEEVYQRGPVPAREFVDLLLAAATAVTVVLTLRADFLSRALEHPALSAAIQDSMIVTGRMTRDQLRRAIEGPLPTGIRYEAGLVDRILADAGDDPGHLALLEFSLTVLWERRTGDLLTHMAYQALGGVAGALTRYADDVCRPATTTTPELIRLFRQLVRPDGGQQPTRRVARRTELGETLWPVAQRLATTRLIVIGRDDAGVETAELAHEALVTGWERLRGWVEADRDFRIWQERLRTAMEQHRLSGEDTGTLLRGAPLAEAQRWLRERATDVGAQERAFIEAGARWHGRVVRGLRALVAGLVVLLVLAGGLGVAGAVQRRDLARQERLATSRALAAQADATVNERPIESILLSLQAAAEADTAEARGGVLRHFLAHANTVTLLAGHADRVAGVAFGAGGRLLASGSVDGSVRLWDVGARRESAILTAHTDRVYGLAFSPDGRVLASAGDDRVVRLWDVAARRQIAVLAGHRDRARRVAFTSDGRSLASADVAGTVLIWDLATRRARHTLAGHTGWVRGVAFAPDGSRLATAGVDGTLRFWDPASGRQTARLGGQDGPLRAVTFAPDGATVAGAGDDGTVRLWEVPGGRPVAALAGHTDVVTSVTFAADGRRLLSAGQDGTVRVWDVAGRQEIARHRGHIDWISGVAFSPDGHTLATAGQDHTIRVWDTATSRSHIRLAGHTGPVTAVAYRPDGRALATASEDGTLRFWDPGGGPETARLTGHTGGVSAVAFSPDGTIAATAGADRTVRLWDVPARRQIASLSGHTDVARGAAFSPDGRILATTGHDRTVRLWDVAGRRELAALTGHTGWVSAVAFSHDGALLATGSDDRTVRLWDVAGRRELAALTGHSGWVSALAFVAGDRTLVSAGQDATIRVWDLTNRRARSILTGHTGWIWSIAASRDGRTIASGADDETIRLWDIDARRELATVTEHHGWVSGLAFSPDGRKVASASADHVARLWDVDAASSRRRLCALAGRELTAQEWADFLPGRPYRRACWRQ